MKIEARLFLGTTGVVILFAVIYAFWTKVNDQVFSEAVARQTEWAGLAGLVLSAGLLGIAGSFFWFISRRIEPRPEDRDDAEIAEGAGELGFFSPHSYWPIAIAGAATVIGIGAAFLQTWLMIVGIALVLFTICGLVFEYYIGGNRPLR